ncbi:DUF6599 family protein [candidate division KSB1 bacterium]
MKASNKIFIIVLITGILMSGCSGSSSNKSGKMLSYFPKTDEVSGWAISREAEEYKGDDLFVYIDGGAELYHEYGFSKVVTQEYKNEDSDILIAELYEMNDISAAYGIYSFRTGKRGEKVDFSKDALFEGYYINLWKEKYLLTITGFNEQEKTAAGIKSIAKIINSKLPPSGDKPELVKKLPAEGLDNLSIKYFEGYLGLFNSYSFHTIDIFGISEGVRGDYVQDHSLYILKFEDEQKCVRKFENALNTLKDLPKYSDFQSTTSGFSLKDVEGKLLFFKRVQNHICIVIGAKNRQDADKIINGLQL